MAEIRLENLGKQYPNGFQAVTDVDLHIADGEFLVLVGPSGCGKSTLLRMIAGLEDISEGDLVIGDRIVNDESPRERDIAMVFQNYALYPHMTVRKNIGYSLRIAKLPKDEIKRRVEEAAELLELGDLLDQKPGLLSGGQRQRVAMGRAIVRQPAAFLMDEPLSNLDAKLRVQMRAEIARLQRRLGVTTVYVTHDQVEAMTMGTRVAVLKDGLLQQVDTPQALAAGIEQDVTIGIRPEAFTAITTSKDTRPTIQATVQLIEALGAELVIHMDIDAPAADIEDPDPAEAVPITAGTGAGSLCVARLPPKTEVDVGDVIHLVVDTSDLQLFDPTSGLTLRGAA